MTIDPMALHQALYAALGGVMQVDADEDGSLSVRHSNVTTGKSGTLVFNPVPATTEEAVTLALQHFGGQ